METHEYSPGQVVPVTSSLYRVVHDPPGEGEQLHTFYAGQGSRRVQNAERTCGTEFPPAFLNLKLVAEREIQTDPLPTAAVGNLRFIVLLG